MEEKLKLTLLQKWEDIYVYVVNDVLKDLPKRFRPSLGRKIADIMLDTHDTIKMFSLFIGDRMKQLDQVDFEAKNLLSKIELGIDVKAIPEKRGEVLGAKLAEIGRIVGGLKKKVPNGRNCKK